MMSETEVPKLEISCPTCGSRYRVPRANVNKLAKCKCGVQFRIEGPEPAAAEDYAIEVEPLSNNASTSGLPPPPLPAEILAQSAATGFGDAAARQCQQHPESNAVALCKSCQAPICATCDFVFPNGVHLCPECATSDKPSALSSGRKTMVVWAMLCAGFTTIMTVLSFFGAFERFAAQEPGQTILGTVIMLPLIAGLALAISSLDSRAGNPLLVWINLIWNIVMTVVWLLLTVIGLTMV